MSLASPSAALLPISDGHIPMDFVADLVHRPPHINGHPEV
jgi:hypothetical protein